MAGELEPILAQHTDQSGDHLMISVASAVYDEDRQLASIRLTDAFQKKNAITGYDGGDVTVVYQGANVDPDTCPDIDVSASEIERRINPLANSVTLNVSGITPQEAGAIEGAKCFNVDTDVVQEVVNRPFSL